MSARAQVDTVAQPGRGAIQVGPPPATSSPRRRHRLPSWALKVTMAVTGVVWAAFVAIHLFGNLKIFQGPEAYNHYAHWLREAFYPLMPKQSVLLAMTERPESPQEPAGALDARIRPFQRLFRRAREHHEEPRGIGAVAVDQRLRIDPVVLALRHLLDRADRDRRAVEIIEQRVHPVLEQRQPVLHAGMAAAFADRFVQEIVALRRTEGGDVAHPETADGFGDQLKFRDRHQIERAHRQQRTLGFRVETADRFQAVAKEVEPHGLVEPGREVVVAEPGAPLADAIRALLADPTRARAIATAAWRRTWAEHTWERRIDALPPWVQGLTAAAILVIILGVGPQGVAPFIYFQF